MQRNDILDWLRETEPERLARLYRNADHVRAERVGSDVHLRGLVEISNECIRSCHYCGLRAPNAAINRYRLPKYAIIDCARQARMLGYGTVVLQSGEDPELHEAFISDVIRGIKNETGLAVTLSLGEREPCELEAWRTAGADRYLLKFETSNRAVYRRAHPRRPGGPADRFGLLACLRQLDYEVGSGAMVGIPGQTYEDLANDLELFASLDLDMIGIGPFIPHPDTPMGRPSGKSDLPAEQVPNSVEMTCKAMALTRQLCPDVNMPTTTALGTLDPEDGFEKGLRCGANVLMPDLTPSEYSACYAIYPGKGAHCSEPVDWREMLARRILELGRTIGTGRGDSLRHIARQRVRENDGNTAETHIKS